MCSIENVCVDPLFFCQITSHFQQKAKLFYETSSKIFFDKINYLFVQWGSYPVKEFHGLGLSQEDSDLILTT